MLHKIDNQTFFTNHQTPCWKTVPIVVAWKCSSAQNLGALLRVCDNFGVQQVYFVGDEKAYKLSKIKRNATTAINKVNWKFVTANELWRKIPSTMMRIAVDTTSESFAINDYNFKPLKNSCCLFFGNETTGLENEVLLKCDTSIHIPMVGNSFSMNVVQCASVVLYEIAKQCLLQKR